MPKSKGDEINFEINLTKAKWEPKTIEDIPRVVSRSFETELTLRDLKPLVGTDHVKTWPLDKDSDIPVFIKEKSMLNEAFAEKVIRYQLPKGVFPKNWQPKKVKILAKGEKVAKYFGEDQMGERNVQVSLKLFECGHFYMKQTLPGQGISPHWTIFEGKWEHSDRGLKLEYLIRYSWQMSRKPLMDLNIEAVPEAGWSNTLAWSGESETQLNGNVPAIVGTEKWAWVEIYRDADFSKKEPARFNDDIDEGQCWNSVPKAMSNKDGDAAPETVMKRGTATEASVQQRREARDNDSLSAPTASSQSRSTSAATPATSSGSTGGQAAAVKTGDGESDVPLYVALAIFVVVCGFFAWQKVKEISANWAAERDAGELW